MRDYSGDKHLPDVMRESIRNLDNEVYVSVVSLWEAIIKHKLGKPQLPQSPEKYLPIQREKHQISSLVIDEGCVSQLANLPPIHRDPFDRMLICQAIEHGLTIVTVDDVICSYSVMVLNRT